MGKLQLKWSSAPDRSKQEVYRLKGHSSGVYSVAASPVAAQIASGAWDKEVRLWDLASGRTKVFRGHEDGVYAVAFCPSGRRIASGSADNSVRVWDIDSGEATVLSGHEDAILTVAFHPTRNILASGGRDATIRLWDLDTGSSRILTKIEPDGREENWPEKEYSPQWDVASIAFSPDGHSILAACHDHSVSLIDLATGTRTYWEGHNDLVKGACFSKSGDFAVTGGWEPDLMRWDFKRGRGERLNCNLAVVYDVDCHPNDKWVACASAHSVKLVELETSRIYAAGGEDTRLVNSVAFTHDGALVAAGCGDGSVRVYSVSGLMEPSPRHSQIVTTLEVAGDGSWFASGAGDGEVRIWDTQTGRSRKFDGCSNMIDAMAASHSGDMIAAASRTGEVVAWDVKTGEAINRFAHPHWVFSLAFDGAGEALISGSLDGSLNLWGLADGKNRPFAGHEAGIHKLAVAQRRGLIATGDRGGVIKLWAKGCFEAIHTLEAQADLISELCFSKDERLLLAGVRDGTIVIWDLAAGEIKTLRAHEKMIGRLALSDDNRYLLACAWGQPARIWELQSGEARLCETAPEGAADGVLAPDGTWAVTNARHGLTLWSAQTGQAIKNIDMPAGITEMRYSRGRNQIVAGDANGDVFVFDLTEA